MGGYISKKFNQNEQNIDQTNLWGNSEELTERDFSQVTAKFKIKNTIASNSQNENAEKSLNSDNGIKKNQIKKFDPEFMKENEIFELYIEMIEKNFKQSHKKFKNLQEKKQSRFYKIKEIIRETTKSEHSGFTAKSKQIVDNQQIQKKLLNAFMNGADQNPLQTNENNLTSVFRSEVGQQDEQNYVQQIQEQHDKYTMIGFVFVNGQSIDIIQQLRENILTKIKHFPDIDSYWVTIVVLFLTLQEQDIDLRLQKVLLDFIFKKLDGNIDDQQILDATKYKLLYIAQVYENNQNQSNDITADHQIYKNSLRKLKTLSQNSYIFQSGKEDDESYLYVDRIGLIDFPCNETFIQKFMTIDQHLRGDNIKASDSQIEIDHGKHPLKLLIQIFQEELHKILQQKIEKEIFRLKQEYLQKLREEEYQNFQRKNQMSCDDKDNQQVYFESQVNKQEILEQSMFQIDDIELIDVIDAKTQHIFKFFLDKAIQHIIRFGMILQSAISGFYGEMEHLPNTTNKIVNLITSEILQSHIEIDDDILNNKNNHQIKDLLTEINDDISVTEQLANYQGTYKVNCHDLSQNLRNIYSLSKRQEIVHTLNYILDNYFKQEFNMFNQYQKQCFEESLNVIAKQVQSPIAKVSCLKQQLQKLEPKFLYLNAEEMQEIIQELIYGCKYLETIENLFIDIQIINDFISDDQKDVLGEFQIIRQIETVLRLYMNENLKNIKEEQNSELENEMDQKDEIGVNNQDEDDQDRSSDEEDEENQIDHQQFQRSSFHERETEREVYVNGKIYKDPNQSQLLQNLQIEFNQDNLNPSSRLSNQNFRVLQNSFTDDDGFLININQQRFQTFSASYNFNQQLISIETIEHI